MRMESVLYLVGVVIILQFRELPSIYYFLPFFIILLFFHRYDIARYTLWLLAGSIWTIIFSTGLLERRLEASYETKDIYVTGYISSLPDYKNNVVRFNFQVVDTKDLQSAHIFSLGKIRLSWYSPSQTLGPGDRLELKVRLKRPHGYFNPGGFDYEAWLFKEKITATGYISELYSHSPSSKNSSLFNTYRFHIRNNIERYQHSYRNATALSNALLIGDRSMLSERHREVLYNSGTTHLIAISGLHIGLIGAIGFFIARWIWSVNYKGLNFIPAKTVASVFSFLGAFIYSELAGFSVPTQRALIMLAMALLHINLKNQSSKSSLLAIAMIVIITINPLSVLSAGFWLSFFAVSIILLAINSNIMQSRGDRYFMPIKIQYFIFIGMLPVSFYIFNQYSLVAFIANIVAIPWLGTVSLPAFIIALISLPFGTYFSDQLFELAMVTLDILWKISRTDFRYPPWSCNYTTSKYV